MVVKLRMADAKNIARLSREEFITTHGFFGLLLAFAKNDSNGYVL